jgi:L-threonylcarbamoyladenylate synthase
VLDELGDSVDLVLDGGPCSVGVESTIVDVTGETPVVLRRGGVTPEEIAEVLGVEVEVGGRGHGRRPGDARLSLRPRRAGRDRRPGGERRRGGRGVTEQPRRGIGPSASSPHAGSTTCPSAPSSSTPPGPPEDYARVLYSRLREADARGLECLVVVVPPPSDGIGAAVLDRLTRAAHR